VAEPDRAPDVAAGVAESSDVEGEGGAPKRFVLLALLLLLLLCAVATTVEVWVERTPQEREFITRNVECLECHSDMVPETTKASVHNPFLLEDCTTCHTPHGKEVVERVYAVGWKRYQRIRTMLEWLPFEFVIDTFDSAVGIDESGPGGELLSEETSRVVEVESELTQDKRDLCWTCHGDMGPLMQADFRHAPFDKGYCTNCHDPHASDFRVLLKQKEEDLCPSCHPIGFELARDQLHPPFEGRYCTNCHDPHASDYYGILLADQRDLCFRCHPSVGPLSLKAVQHAPFLNADCTSCHEPHGSEYRPLLITSQPTLCYLCHPGIENDFARPSAHPVDSIELDCGDCHDPHGADYRYLLTAEDNRFCYQCHGTAIRASYDASKHERVLCIGCHTPHGSDFAPILRDRNPDVCLRCHVGYDGENRHPVHPTYYDVSAGDPLTCTSTCHGPHGTGQTAMLHYAWPRDGVCLACHSAVGFEF
jgi:predicted CXXCH cytochrome family protein